MLFKTLLLLLLLYFAFKAVGNLIAAVRQDAGQLAHGGGPAPPPRPRGREIEEARWEDLP